MNEITSYRPKETIGTFRRIVQIATTRVENTSSTQCHWIVYALCDDGTLWEKAGDYAWTLVDTTEITKRRIQR